MSEDQSSIPPAQTSGIYSITSARDGKIYVGSAVDIKQRWGEHSRKLRGNRHPNRHLQNAFCKYGEENFTFAVVETAPPEQLIAREQWWLDHHDAARRSCGYNLARVAGSTLGFRHSRETRARLAEKLSVAARNRSAEHRKKLADTHRGKPLSLEHREKIALANKARYARPEERSKTSAANKARYARPEERVKLSLAAQAQHARARLDPVLFAQRCAQRSATHKARCARERLDPVLFAQRCAQLAAANKARADRARLARAAAAATPPTDQKPPGEWVQGERF